jgi:succinate dehydrogenase/fumarate reductase flavoprotein subunit
VTGVKIEQDGAVHTVHTSNGVIIATGGFEWDKGLVKAFLRGPMEHPASLPSNTGDGLRMAMRAGAMLGNMREAWWMPALVIPGEERYGEQKVSLVLRERALPGCIIVNRKGKRFCNESTNYNAISGAFHQFDPMKFEYANLPCWLVFDQAYVDKYGFWDIPPGGSIPHWVARSDDPAALGRQVGFDGVELGRTLARWNTMVLAGKDEDFARGQSAYDGWNGDISRYPDASATLGTIAKGPFYAAQLRSSCLGTKGGPQTDRHGAVLDVDNHPIPGLYAVGNAMAGATGMSYGGAGGTIGPAMVFGYLAGRHAASHPQALSNR